MLGQGNVSMLVADGLVLSWHQGVRNKYAAADGGYQDIAV